MLPDFVVDENAREWTKERKVVRVTAHASWKMLCICTLSRQVVLETWTKEVAAAMGCLTDTDGWIIVELYAGCKITCCIDGLLWYVAALFCTTISAY